jgi:putative ABC transport system permease protein
MDSSGLFTTSRKRHTTCEFFYSRTSLFGGTGLVETKIGVLLFQFLGCNNMRSVVHDLTHALRLLRRQPAFASVAIATLALGIGATAAIFSVVNAVLLRPLPFRDPDRLVRISEEHANATGPANLTYATFRDLIASAETLEHVSAARFWTDSLNDVGREPEQVSTLLVTTAFFDALGIPAELGRVFVPNEDQPGSDRVVIISHGLWQRRYGGDRAIVGKTVNVSDIQRTVIGVMPADFKSDFLFAGQYDLWVPLVTDGPLRSNRRSHLLGVIARLKEPSTAEQARSEMSSIAAAITDANPGVDPDLRLSISGLKDRLIAPVRTALLVLLGAVACVLLIACANVANLLLSQSASREREMAIRAALGARSGRLARQLFTESALLGVLGGAVGLLLAFWGVDSIASLDSGRLPRLAGVKIDGTVLCFALASSLLTALVFGLAPVLRLRNLSLHQSLKDDGRATMGPKAGWVRGGLIISEVCLSFVLLTGAGLLINSFWRMLNEDRGFDPHNVLTVNLTLPSARYPDAARQTSFLKQVLARLSSAPQIEAAGLISSLPLTGGPATDFVIEGRPPAKVGEHLLADIRIVDENYFQTMRIALRSGRRFMEFDTSESNRVMIINERMARTYWPDRSPIGEKVTMKDWGPPLTGEIIGVVADTKASALDTQTRPMIYWPYTQFTQVFNDLVIRTDAPAQTVVGSIKESVWEVDPSLPVANIATMDQVVQNSVAPRRFNTLLLALFAALALALAAIGVYGVVSYSVSQQTREIGIRMALGAQRRDVLRIVLGRGAGLIGVGICIGLAAALATTRVMATLLYGVTASDFPTLACVAALLALVALAACYIPARRAMNVDPVEALRHQ